MKHFVIFTLLIYFLGYSTALVSTYSVLGQFLHYFLAVVLGAYSNTVCNQIKERA